jgi:hypothetical protein
LKPFVITLRNGDARTKKRVKSFAVSPSLLLALLRPGFVLADDTQATEVVRRVVGAQKHLPWFWSPPTEGLADIDYTYEIKHSRRVLDHRGKEVLPQKVKGGFCRPWRSVHMERIALDEGSYYRCLMQDGISPCSEELMQALERDTHKRENFTPEEKAKVRRIREERYRSSQLFWTEFPKALRFEQIGLNGVRFVPSDKYQPQHDSRTAALAEMAGQFWFDPLTYEITRMEYEMLGDVDTPVVPLSKGMSFSIELARSVADGPLLPTRVSIRRKVSKGRRTEDSSSDLFNFRRFAVESEVWFIETDEADKIPK